MFLRGLFENNQKVISFLPIIPLKEILDVMRIWCMTQNHSSKSSKCYIFFIHVVNQTTSSQGLIHSIKGKWVNHTYTITVINCYLDIKLEASVAVSLCVSVCSPCNTSGTIRDDTEPFIFSRRYRLCCPVSDLQCDLQAPVSQLPSSRWHWTFIKLGRLCSVFFILQ